VTHCPHSPTTSRQVPLYHWFGFKNVITGVDLPRSTHASLPSRSQLLAAPAPVGGLPPE